MKFKLLIVLLLSLISIIFMFFTIEESPSNLKTTHTSTKDRVEDILDEKKDVVKQIQHPITIAKKIEKIETIEIAPIAISISKKEKEKEKEIEKISIKKQEKQEKQEKIESSSQSYIVKKTLPKKRELSKKKELKTSLITPMLIDTVLYVDENAPAHTRVGNVKIFRAGDSPIVKFTLYGVGSKKFRISSSGLIRVRKDVTLDYEQSPSYALSAIAKNSAGDSGSVYVDIVINDLEEKEADSKEILKNSISKITATDKVAKNTLIEDKKDISDKEFEMWIMIPIWVISAIVMIL